MQIQIKKVSKSARLPYRGSAHAAGYDLFADIAEEIRIAPGETLMIGTGLAMAIPEGYFGGVFARSGLASKQGLRPANCTGVIDADYRGEIKVPLHNDSNQVRVISPQEKIAQLLILPFLAVDFLPVTELPLTERGEDGFGSTGV